MGDACAFFNFTNFLHHWVISVFHIISMFQLGSRYFIVSTIQVNILAFLCLVCYILLCVCVCVCDKEKRKRRRFCTFDSVCSQCHNIYFWFFCVYWSWFMSDFKCVASGCRLCGTQQQATWLFLAQTQHSHPRRLSTDS